MSITNERSILSSSTGSGEVRERGPAGAEVVERDAHAEVGDRVERRGGALGVGDQAILGHLERQRRRRDVVLGEQPRDVGGEAGSRRSETARLTATVRSRPSARHSGELGQRAVEHLARQLAIRPEREASERKSPAA